MLHYFLFTVRATKIHAQKRSFLLLLPQLIVQLYELGEMLKMFMKKFVLWMELQTDRKSYANHLFFLHLLVLLMEDAFEKKTETMLTRLRLKTERLIAFVVIFDL